MKRSFWLARSGSNLNLESSLNHARAGRPDAASEGPAESTLTRPPGRR